MYVQITRVNEATNDLILSERAAWVSFGVVLCFGYSLIFPNLRHTLKYEKYSDFFMLSCRKCCISRRELFWKELLRKFLPMGPK